MASCPVPDIPAVQIALEHLGELDKQLRDEGVPLCLEASLHLREITAAIAELVRLETHIQLHEGSRRKAHEQLEVETIETSKLRHELQIIRGDVSDEISAAVAAARDVNASQTSQLQEELNSIRQETEAVERKQEVLEKQNSILFPERELVKGNHEDVINRLNVQLSEKASKQIVLNQTLGEVRAVQSQRSGLEEARLVLEQDMVQERQAVDHARTHLHREVEQSDCEIQEQKKNNAETQRELDIINCELLDQEDKANELRNRIAQLEQSIARLTASESQCKEQLENEMNRYEELSQLKAFHDTELVELREAFQLEAQSLQEEILLVDSEMEEVRATNKIHLESMAMLSDSFKSQRKEEDDAMAEQLHFSRRLEMSKLRLEERIASIAKHRIEIREMEEEIKQLHDTNVVNEDLFQRNLEELHGQLNREKKSIAMFEVEREELSQSLEDLKRDHERYVEDVDAQICSTRKRYQQLREEESRLQDHVFMGSLIEKLKLKASEAELDHGALGVAMRGRVLQHLAEGEEVTRGRLEKEEELKAREEVLGGVEARFDIDQARHQALKKHTSELKSTKNQLELSIQDMEERTHTLLQPKESMRGQLQALRLRQVDLLTGHSVQISVTETSVYQNGLMLEQLTMENSRLHLCIEQMKEDIANARKEKGRHVQQISWLKEEVLSLFGTLLEAWEQDTLLTETSSERDQGLLEALHALLRRIRGRERLLGDVHGRLEQQLSGLSALLAGPDRTGIRLSASQA